MDSETLITTLPALSTLVDNDQQAILAHVKKIMDEPRMSAPAREEKENQTEHAMDVEIPSMLEWMLQVEEGTRNMKVQRVSAFYEKRPQKGDRAEDAFDNLTWPTCAHFIWPTLS